MALCSLPCEKQLPRHSAAWTSPLRPLPCSHLRQQGLQAVGDGQLVQHGGPAGTEAQQASLQGGQARGSLYLQRSLPGRSGIRMGHWASKGAAAPPLAHKQQHGKPGQACATLCSVQTEQVHAAFETQMQGAAAAHLMISGSVTLPPLAEGQPVEWASWAHQLRLPHPTTPGDAAQPPATPLWHKRQWADRLCPLPSHCWQPRLTNIKPPSRPHLRKVSSASWLAPPGRSTRREKSASRADTRKIWLWWGGDPEAAENAPVEWQGNTRRRCLRTFEQPWPQEELKQEGPRQPPHPLPHLVWIQLEARHPQLVRHQVRHVGARLLLPQPLTAFRLCGGRHGKGMPVRWVAMANTSAWFRPPQI